MSVLAGLAWTFTQPRLYEAATTLVVSSSEPTPAAQVAAVTNARTLLENRRAAERIIRQFNLTAPPDRLSPDTLVRDRLQISQIRDTNFLRVTLQLSSPAAASDALGALVQAGIDLNQQLNVENTIALTGSLITKQVEEARRKMEKASSDLLAFQQQAQIDRLRGDTQTLLAQRAMSAEIDADLAAERSRVAGAERQLATRPRQLPARRAVTGEGPLLEDARRQSETVSRSLGAVETSAPSGPTEAPRGGKAAADDSVARTDAALPPKSAAVPPKPNSPPLGLPLADPYVDPVYEVLDYQASTGRTKISALEAQRGVLRRQGDRDLFPRLYEKELGLDKLRLEYELASQVYKDLVMRFEAARKEVLSRSVNIQVADPPVPPLHAATPRLLLNVAITTTIGVGGAVLALILLAFTPRSATSRLEAV